MRDIYIFVSILKRLFLYKQNHSLVSTQVFPFDVHFKLRGIFLERHLHLGESHLISPVNQDFRGCAIICSVRLKLFIYLITPCDALI